MFYLFIIIFFFFAFCGKYIFLFVCFYHVNKTLGTFTTFYKLLINQNEILNVKLEAAELRLYTIPENVFSVKGGREEDAQNTFIKLVPLSSGCF